MIKEWWRIMIKRWRNDDDIEHYADARYMQGYYSGRRDAFLEIAYQLEIAGDSVGASVVRHYRNRCRWDEEA